MTAELRKKKHFPIIRDIAVPALTLLLVSWVGVKFRESADVDGMWNDPIFDKLLIVAFTIATAFLLFRLTAIFILDGLLVLSVKRPIPKILKDVVGIFFGFVALLICIGVLFSEAFSSFLALSGILGVVIGLALRPIILDIFSGVSTNMEAAFLIGDWITVKNENVTYTGWVDQINWRTTHIRTRAGNLVVCPNSFLSTSIVTNHSRPYKLSRYEIHLKLPPELPTDRAVTILRNAVQATLNVPGGPSSGKTPDILITELGDSGSITGFVSGWIPPRTPTTRPFTR
jgi:small-conductance mechanosensitive channel